MTQYFRSLMASRSKIGNAFDDAFDLASDGDGASDKPEPPSVALLGAATVGFSFQTPAKAHPSRPLMLTRTQRVAD